MTNTKQTYIVTFFSTYWAMEAERLLKQAGYGCRLRPVPREFSSSCGICAAVEAPSKDELLNFLAENELEHEAFYGPWKGAGR